MLRVLLTNIDPCFLRHKTLFRPMQFIFYRQGGFIKMVLSPWLPSLEISSFVRFASHCPVLNYCFCLLNSFPVPRCPWAELFSLLFFSPQKRQDTYIEYEGFLMEAEYTISWKLQKMHAGSKEKISMDWVLAGPNTNSTTTNGTYKVFWVTSKGPFIYLYYYIVSQNC